MKTDRYKENKAKTGRTGIIVCIALALVVWLVLILVYRALTKGEEKVDIVVASRPINEYVTITKDNAGNYFEVISCAKSLAFGNSYSSLDEMFKNSDSIYTTFSITQGEIVSGSMVVGKDVKIEDFTDPVEMGIKVSSFEHAAGGTLRRGDYVDMSALDGNGTEFTTELFILKAFDSDGGLISMDDDVSVAVAFTVLMERSAYEDVAGIAALGSFDLIKTNDIH